MVRNGGCKKSAHQLSRVRGASWLLIEREASSGSSSDDGGGRRRRRLRVHCACRRHSRERLREGMAGREKEQSYWLVEGPRTKLGYRVRAESRCVHSIRRAGRQ